MKYDISVEEELQSLPSTCASSSARRLARVLTNAYDKALAPVSLNSAQFGLLAALNKCGGAPMTQLAGLLDLERTTLTRNIAVLQKSKLAVVGKGIGDARTRIVSITPAGKQRLIEALPLWRAVQVELGAESIVKKLNEITVTETT
jgi:DNA-binding MarR family transcriptional regulator